MFAPVISAIRALFAPASTGHAQGWAARFLPHDLKDLECDRGRFNPARDLCW